VTLIEVRNSEGCVGRCDAKCYGATDERCACVCGGRNHGVGKGRAIENTREMVREGLCGGDPEREVKVTRLIEQLQLFSSAEVDGLQQEA
jgi:hypothetical protein